MLARTLSVLLASTTLFACAAGNDDSPREAFQDDPAPAAAKDPNAPPVVTHDAPAAPAAPNQPVTPQAPEATPDAQPNTCETAIDLGEVNADDSFTKSAQGKCSTWYRLRLKESSGFLFNLTAGAQLVSPSDEKFDLFLYVDKSKDQVECKTPTDKSDTPAGSVDEADVTLVDWPFSDDSRTLSIEVRSHSGRCSTKGNFSLVLKDNPPPPTPVIFAAPEAKDLEQ